MKLFYVIIFQCVFVFGFSQSAEILNVSSFKHDYFITDLQYVEALKDTANLQYIATLKISGIHNDILLEDWHLVLKTNAKRLGANLYYIESFNEDETNATMVLRLFFAGVNFMKANKAKANKNTIYIFNEGRSKDDTAYFYLNQKKIAFDPKKYYTINTIPYKLYNISMTQKKAAKKNKSFPKDAESVFYILPLNKKSVIVNSVNNTTKPAAIRIKKTKPEECNYNLGRFFLEIYK
ncbi:MAG: hypothetical protein ABIP51_09350 [Bacteroidia bacterium]